MGTKGILLTAEDRKPKRICMLLANPVTNDPRVRREAASLAKSGYAVMVIGAQADGYVWEEELDGYQVIRVPTLRRLYRRRVGVKHGRSPSTAGRSTGFLTKLLADVHHIISVIYLNSVLTRVALRQNADVYHSHDLDTLLAGYLVKRWAGKKLIYDFHELFTEQFKKGIRTGLWRLFYSAMERFLIKQADQLVTVCDSLASWVSQRYGVKKGVTVRNVPVYQKICRCQVKTGDDRVILYHGAYFRNRGLEQLIESAEYLENARIVLRGYGDHEEHLRALAKSKGLEGKVCFAPPVPMTELVRVASEADIGVAPFLPVCLNTQFCLPNKLFEYMMAGLAIVGTDLPEMRRIILGHNLGVVFNHPENPRNIAKAINELLKNDARLEEMKQNALQAARVLNWESEGEILLKCYDALMDQRDIPEVLY